jgi:hypothetical protein
VEFTVNKEWLYESDEAELDDTARISLFCDNVADGDGQENNGTMSWSWIFTGQSDSHTALVYPRFNGITSCWAQEQALPSAVESINECLPPTTVRVGDGPHSCMISNTVFFEGIPTLNQYGLLLFSALMLMTGMVAARRF